MSIISTVVKGALSLDQKVQGVVHKVAHSVATAYFKRSQTTEENALENAENQSLALERRRAQAAADLLAAQKKALIRLHEGFDNELDLVDGRKTMMLGQAAQQRAAAVDWQSTAICADLAAENARKAAGQLG
jgi:methyl coenzyme M reductase beta subunit